MSGLETVADRFLSSLRGVDAATQAEVFGVLYCNQYLNGYEPVAATCNDLLGAPRCTAIAARCRASATE